MPRDSLRFPSRLVLLVLAGSAAVSLATASLCVWRQPDADIAAVFGSGTYKTVFVDVSAAMADTLEQRLGYPLDPDETQFKFFPVYRSGRRVGTVMTHAGKGQYGAIEVVVAVVESDSGTVVKSARIQRDREKAKAALRGAAFLGQFRGMRAADDFTLGSRVRTAATGAERASQAVAAAVRKLLIVFEEMDLGRPIRTSSSTVDRLGRE
jgi:hypothetical protein